MGRKIRDIVADSVSYTVRVVFACFPYLPLTFFWRYSTRNWTPSLSMSENPNTKTVWMAMQMMIENECFMKKRTRQ